MEETIKTINTNMVEVTKIELIDLKPLKDKIAEIDKQLALLPALKNKPDQETLEYWNNNNVINSHEKSYLLEQKNNLQELLNKYEKK